jgi:hypothetical protein
VAFYVGGIFPAWSAVRHGRFMVGAGERGLCYRIRGKGQRYVVLAWCLIATIKVNKDAGGDEMLLVGARIDASDMRPPPSRTKLITENGARHIAFSTWGSSNEWNGVFDKLARRHAEVHGIGSEICGGTSGLGFCLPKWGDAVDACPMRIRASEPTDRAAINRTPVYLTRQHTTYILGSFVLAEREGVFADDAHHCNSSSNAALCGAALSTRDITLPF